MLFVSKKLDNGFYAVTDTSRWVDVIYTVEDLYKKKERGIDIKGVGSRFEPIEVYSTIEDYINSYKKEEKKKGTDWLKFIVKGNVVGIIDCDKDAIEIDIPDFVAVIGIRAFENCAKLRSVFIPSTVKAIRYGAFMGCRDLRSITIPRSVKVIGESVFKNSGVVSVNLFSQLSKLHDCLFEGCCNLRTVDIPNTVEEIGKRVFADCKALTGVKLPSSLSLISSQAFDGCLELNNLRVPNRINSTLIDTICEMVERSRESMRVTRCEI